MQKIESLREAIFFTKLVKCLKIMGWENYSSELKNALITNFFGDKLLRDLKNIYTKYCTSKFSSFWPTVKRMPRKKTSIILTTTVQHLYISHAIIQHHSTQDVANHIYESVHDFISPCQYEGGSYDGAYHHANDSVPLKLDRMFGVPSEGDGAVHSDHDYLHRAGLSEGQAKKKEDSKWVNNVCETLTMVYNDHNYGKNYEELRDISIALDVHFSELKKFSKTRFANHAKKVFLSTYQDLVIIIRHYEIIKRNNSDSRYKEQRDKGEHAQLMLNKIKNKEFILKLAGLVDIYNIFSELVSELQIVNVLPFERLYNFRRCNEQN